MVSYVNLFENEDFMMRLLAGEFDSAIKKGKMKMEPVFYNKDEYNEADSIEETVETVEVEETQKCTDIEKAIACKDELISLWDHEMCENFDCLSSELTNYIDVLHDLNLTYHVVVSDLELKIEVRAVELE